MSATWSFDEQPRTGDALLPGASPAAIRAALLPDDQALFDRAYADALAAARDQLDLTELLRCLESWRRLALLQRDPINTAFPDAPVRTLVFGAQSQGLITYLILEDQRRVDILKVLWIG
jgi:hypothetical protein